MPKATVQAVKSQELQCVKFRGAKKKHFPLLKQMSIWMGHCSWHSVIGGSSDFFDEIVNVQVVC